VLVAFVMLLTFESYSTAKAEAGQEATAVAELFHTAALFSPPSAGDLQGQLICYGRAVRDDEWRTMRHGRESELVKRWLDELDRSSERLVLRDEKQSSRPCLVSSLLIVHFLDRPYENRSGSIQPVEMERTSSLIDRDSEGAGQTLSVPCDAGGRPLS